MTNTALIGIDYSINSAAICVYYNNGINFISLARDNYLTKDMEKLLFDYNIHRYEINRINLKGTISQQARDSTWDCRILANNAINSINKIFDGNKPDVIVAIEGFSYAAKGNRLTELAGYQYVLRSLLIDTYNVTKDNMFIFSPQTVKKTAGASGKGLGKEDVINGFINQTELIGPLSTHKFYEALKTEPERLQTKSGKWNKPVDDLVDAYFVLKSLFVELKLS